MIGKKQDVEKERYWQRTIGEAARSGISIPEFCRQRRLKECQFYWWQCKLKAGRQERTMRRQGANESCCGIFETSSDQAYGVEGLLEGDRSGCPPQLSEPQRKQVSDILDLELHDEPTQIWRNL